MSEQETGLVEIEAHRNIELEGAINEAYKKVEEHLPERRASHESITDVTKRFNQELGEISAFLLKARDSLDDLLALREQKHIIDKNGKPLDTKYYEREEQLVIDTVYNSLMALGIRSEADLEDHSPLEVLNSERHKVRAHFVLAELYVALGVNITQAKEEYQEVIEYGKDVFNQVRVEYDSSKDGRLVVPLIRLAYKIGTAHKRLIDIDYHVIGTAKKTAEVYDHEDKNGDGRFVKEEEVPYGYVPTRNGIKSSENRKKARSWFAELPTLNQIAKLSSPEQLDFSHFDEFMRYRQDIEELKVGCVFNVLVGEKMTCITSVNDDYDHSTCPNRQLSSKEQIELKIRAQMTDGAFFRQFI